MHAKMISHLPLKLYGEGGLLLYVILHIHIYKKTSSLVTMWPSTAAHFIRN